jgi:hypothetical protein
MVCVPRPLTLTGHADLTLPNVGCRPIVMRACGPPVAVVDAAHRSACDRSDHTNRGIARDLPRSSEEHRPGWISWFRAPRDVKGPL